MKILLLLLFPLTTFSQLYSNIGFAATTFKIKRDIGDEPKNYHVLREQSVSFSVGVSYVKENFFTGADILMDMRSIGYGNFGAYAGYRKNNLYFYGGGYYYDFNFMNRGFSPRLGVQFEKYFMTIFLYSRLEYSKTSSLTIGFNLPFQ